MEQFNKIIKSNPKNVDKVKESCVREKTTLIQKEREELTNLNLINNNLSEKLCESTY